MDTHLTASTESTQHFVMIQYMHNITHNPLKEPARGGDSDRYAVLPIWCRSGMEPVCGLIKDVQGQVETRAVK